ncbi:amidohydrolase [Thaumasiovibrio sp. DFM-14]|uniref:amidohydrolase n=1 Tax=Thaumasiovibrio sp. DFM-14 TaxID=3384792 RepID=UPI0039A088A0
MKLLKTSAAIALVLSSGMAFANADLIFTNGDIVTVTGENDRAEAIAIKDGKIIAVGSQKEVLKEKGKNTEIRDLDGKTMIPGFIDAHGHITQYLPFVNAPFLYPAPMGDTDSISAMQKALKPYFTSGDLPDDRIHIAWGYDDAEMTDGRHPTRWELDEATGDISMCALHISGHLASCNSAALERLNFTAETENPAGGVIRRAENGEPNGVLEESAIYALFPHLGLTAEEGFRDFAKVQDMFISYGITTAQEGAMTYDSMPLAITLAEAGALKIDIHAYAKWTHYDEMAAQLPVGTNLNRLQLTGVKMVGDGSPQGKTAYLSGPYFEVPHNHALHYHGYAIMPQGEMDAAVLKAFKDGAHILSHANGDAAADILLNAVEKALEEVGDIDHRTTMIHAQTARLDQVERMKKLNMIPSFFTAHTYFWGDWHRDSVLGPWRASNISPTGWANENDLMFTIHMDAPVLFPDMLTAMWASVNRSTRSGDVLGEWHKITPYQALEATTINAAYQHFEEDIKGSLEVGKLADLVILDANPLDVDSMRINEIAVLETIKDGETIYKL